VNKKTVKLEKPISIFMFFEFKRLFFVRDDYISKHRHVFLFCVYKYIYQNFYSPYLDMYVYELFFFKQKRFFFLLLSYCRVALFWFCPYLFISSRVDVYKVRTYIYRHLFSVVMIFFSRFFIACCSRKQNRFFFFCIVCLLNI